MWLNNVRQKKTMQFPDDDNGAVLRRMHDGGDALTKPRIIDYCFAFPARSQAIEFAALVPEPEYEACISFYQERDMWQVIIKKHMIPSHGAISAIETDLAARAQSVGGEPDGWGCMRITEK